MTKQMDIERSVEDIRIAVAIPRLRSALMRLRNCCVCLIVEPYPAASRRELGQILLADLNNAFEAGTLARGIFRRGARAWRESCFAVGA